MTQPHTTICILVYWTNSMDILKHMANKRKFSLIPFIRHKHINTNTNPNKRQLKRNVVQLNTTWCTFDCSCPQSLKQQTHTWPFIGIGSGLSSLSHTHTITLYTQNSRNSIVTHRWFRFWLWIRLFSVHLPLTSNKHSVYLFAVVENVNVMKETFKYIYIYDPVHKLNGTKRGQTQPPSSQI